MAELSKNYNRIISELDKKIKDPQEREFVKEKFSELAVIFMDTIGKVVESNDKQVMLEKRIYNIEKSLKRIEEDIYIEDDNDDDEHECNCSCCGDQMHDNDYEFEILCPYCSYEFVTGKDVDLKNEIECPNCHNVIELDWEDHCDGECNECNNHCYHDEEEEELKLQEEEKNNYTYNSGDLENNKQDNKENEDDM